MEAEITTLLAQVAGGRRHWLRAPQDEALPYVVLQRVSASPHYHMQGQTNLTPTRVQVDCYAESYGEMREVAAHVRKTLSNYRGGAIEAVFIESDRDLPAADTGEATRLFRSSIDIIVHHREG